MASIAQVLAEPPPPAGANYARAQELWEELQTRLAEWNFVTSQSHEGESHSVSLEAQERQILTYYDAYKIARQQGDALEAGAEAPVNPALMATPGSRRFDFSGVKLHQL